MANCTTLKGLVVIGAVVLSTSIALAQPPPGGPPPVGAPPAGATGVPGAAPAMPSQPVDPNGMVAAGDSTGAKGHPTAGGDPLTFSAAGALLLTAGYAVRRRIRKA